MLPRLTGHGAEMSRLGGGIGTRGPGETQLETDRRRIAAASRKSRTIWKASAPGARCTGAAASAVPLATLALVGYTNAGKSTLFNRLTQAGGAGRRAHVRHARPHGAAARSCRRAGGCW